VRSASTNQAGKEKMLIETTEKKRLQEVDAPTLKGWMERGLEAPVEGPHNNLPGSHAPIFGSPVAGVAYTKRLAAYAVIRNRMGTVAAV
jgi:hypothetical protein